ncbi:MAG: PAS domain-containing sensor histidine kinase [Betaproteobacteria bacterium]
MSMRPWALGNWLKPWMLMAVLAVAASVTLNIVAADLGHSPPWLLGLNLTLALLVLGASILAVMRLAARSAVEAKRMRGALNASQARLAASVDSAMDAIISVDENQHIVLFNRAAEQMFRCRREEVLGTSLDRFLPSRFRTSHRSHIEQFGRTGVTSRRMGDVTTLWAVRADDSEEFPIQASISQAIDGDHHYYTVILRDITVRKQYEDELKARQTELRKLSAQVLEAREEEKTRIARELHDELGQLLTAMKMDLGWIRDRVGAGDPELGMKTARMSQTLDQTVTSVRRIAADLRPLMLDDLGLPDAAAWLVEDFGKRSGINCEFKLVHDQDIADFERNVANTVYRALQESLTNVSRHANAKNAWILLRVDESGIRLEIEDNGSGISDADLTKPQSLGLKGMRERVFNIGGVLEVTNAPRGGTRVSLFVPLRRDAMEAVP